MPAATVLFDFDGTLVRGDCAAPWVRAQLRSHPLRPLAACPPGLYRLVRVARDEPAFLTWLQGQGLVRRCEGTPGVVVAAAPGRLDQSVDLRVAGIGRPAALGRLGRRLFGGRSGLCRQRRERAGQRC